MEDNFEELEKELMLSKLDYCIAQLRKINSEYKNESINSVIDTLKGIERDVRDL